MHKDTKEILKRLLTEQEAAEYISVSRSFLRQSRIYGYRQGKRVIFIVETTR